MHFIQIGIKVSSWLSLWVKLRREFCNLWHLMASIKNIRERILRLAFSVCTYQNEKSTTNIFWFLVFFQNSFSSSQTFASCAVTAKRLRLLFCIWLDIKWGMNKQRFGTIYNILFCWLFSIIISLDYIKDGWQSAVRILWCLRAWFEILFMNVLNASHNQWKNGNNKCFVIHCKYDAIQSDPIRCSSTSRQLVFPLLYFIYG